MTNQSIYIIYIYLSAVVAAAKDVVLTLHSQAFSLGSAFGEKFTVLSNRRYLCRHFGPSGDHFHGEGNVGRRIVLISKKVRNF